MIGFTCSNTITLENGLSSNTPFISIDKSEIITKKQLDDLYYIQCIADIYSSYQTYLDGKPMMSRETIMLENITYEQLSSGNPYEVIYSLYLKVKYNQDIVDH